MDHKEMAIASRLLSSDVKKPTALVHFQRKMSPVEQRVMTMLVFNAQETQPDDKQFYEIRTGFVADFLGWEASQNYERLYDAFRAIKQNDIEWNIYDHDMTIREQLICSFLINLEIRKRSGTIRYRFHPDIEPIIKNPNVFAKLKIIMLAILAQPKYAYAMYEFFADAYCRGLPEISIGLDKFKEYLGIPLTSYNPFREFKFQVLRPNLDAVNSISDYDVTYKTYRVGREVGGMTFTISRTREWQQPMMFDKPLALLQQYFATPEPQHIDADKAEDQQGAVSALTAHGVDERTARQAVEKYGAAGALEIRDYVLGLANQSGSTIKDVTKYMATALRKGHGLKTAEQRAEEEAAQAKKAQTGKRDTARATLEAIKRYVKSSRASRVNDRVKDAKQDETMIAAFKDTRDEFHKRQLDAGSWKGLENAFSSFIAEKYLGAEIDALRAYAKEKYGHDYDQLLKDAE